MARVVALALLDVPDGSADVGVDEAAATAEVTVGAADDFDLGRLVTRAEVAAHSEGLRARVGPLDGPGSVTLVLYRRRERRGAGRLSDR